MKKIIFAAMLALSVVAPSQARTERHAIVNVPLEPVDRMQLFGRMQGWRALDSDTLVIWASGLRPYLVELSRPSTDLRFVQSIGVTGFNGRVQSRFDSIVVRGIRYPIEQIYRLTPSDARSLRAL